MDSLIREKNGKEEIWYSQDYLIKQMELAHRAGVHNGIRVEFHAITPVDDESVENLLTKFEKLVDKEYQRAMSNGEVWRIK